MGTPESAKRVNMQRGNNLSILSTSHGQFSVGSRIRPTKVDPDIRPTLVATRDRSTRVDGFRTLLPPSCATCCDLEATLRRLYGPQSLVDAQRSDASQHRWRVHSDIQLYIKKYKRNSTINTSNPG